MDDSSGARGQALHTRHDDAALIPLDRAATLLEVTDRDLLGLVGDGAIRAVGAGDDLRVDAADVDRLARARHRLVTPEPDRLMTPAEVARRFGVKPKTVSAWAEAGKLPAVFTAGGHRRYRERDVRKLLDGVAADTNDSRGDTRA